MTHAWNCIRALGICLGLAMIVAAQLARAELSKDDALGGHIVAEVDGHEIAFPILKTEITGDLQGDIATIRVRQVFANPTRVPLNARYLFPLNKDAAVHAMTMQVADEIVRAVIQKKEEARKTFETAKQEGKSAALLEQQRPNMFTQEIANLMPGMPVTVTLEYSQVVPRVDGAYELRVPLVVGPRYVPADGPVAQVVSLDDPVPTEQPIDLDIPSSEAFGAWTFDRVPDYPEVFGLTIPATVDKDRVSIRLSLESGMPISSVGSTTHGIDVTGSDTAKTVALGGGATIDNRDFVLRYSLAGALPQAGLLTHRAAAQDGTAENIFSILIEPPAAAKEGDIAPREIVFVLDTSGSMSGIPIEASKTFMRHALKTLRPADYFRIITFANHATEFSAGPVPATPENLTLGAGYVDGLQPGGGTEILAGLRAAYGRPTPPNLLRIVVFLSDGYVGNEAEILKMVARDVGRGRLYAFGVGTAVNRYLIVEMARQGRGISRIMDPTTDGNTEAIALAGRIESPVLTDISIDWGDLKPEDVTPAFIPDLFAGDSIRVQGRFPGDKARTVQVRGKVNGRPMGLPLQIAPAAEGAAGGEAIPLIWARSMIEDHMREMMVPGDLRTSKLSDDDLKAMVTDLGLKHSLVTQWTSFVAVPERVVNPNPGSAVDADVPLPMVDGVSDLAYPEAGARKVLAPSIVPVKAQATGGTQLAFAGGATPEPEQWLGLTLLLVVLGGAAIRARRRAA